MTPIYASDRLDASGWYAYKQPPGQLVIWDGGANRGDNAILSGFWCPYSGKPIQLDSEWLNTIPQMPMYGFLDHKTMHFTVTDFPHVDEVLNVTGRTTDNPVYFMVGQDGHPLHFYLSVLNAPTALEKCPNASFVRCRILPEDAKESLRVAREMGDDTLIRHPHSFWTRKRNPLFASVGQPPSVPVRVREVILDEKGYVDEVVAWQGPQRLIKFYPLYEGDQYANNPVFFPKNKLNLYMNENIVLGYD